MPFARPIKSIPSWSVPLFFILLLFELCTGPAPAQSQPPVDLSGKNILILHSYEANTPVFVQADRGLSKALELGGIPSLNQFFESLDLRRNSGPEQRKLLREGMRVRYSLRKLDMIITMYPEALEFVLKDCRDILSVAPILATILPVGFKVPKTDRRIIGHFARLDILGTLEIALKLVPGAKRVYLVSGAHQVDRSVENQARRDLKKWETRLEFIYLNHMPFEDILAAISRVPPGSIILSLAFSQDVAGKSYTTPIVVQQLSQVSPAPVFGILDYNLGYGIAGGSLVNFEHIGAQAGQLVLNILRGTKTPENMPNVLDVPPVPMFDWRQLRHWNLSENALPKGSIVINKELTLWDFRYHVIGALVFVLVQSVLIAWLLVQKRRRKSAEESLRQKTEELDQFFNVSLDLFCIANTEGYFLRLNPAWESILGYSGEELTAKRFFDFIHPDDLARTREAVSTLASQEKVIYFENRYRCKDGTYRWLQWSATPAGKLIYAGARDVTKRKQAEKTLKDRLIFETLLAEISALFINLPADRIDDEIKDTQRRICELLDIDRSTLWQVSKGEPQSLLLTHIHQPTETLHPPDRLRAGDFFPWTVRKVLDGETVIISKMTDLPPEAGRDRESFDLYGSKSGVYVPLSVGKGPVLGLLTFAVTREERRWAETAVMGFKLIAQVFANALARKQAEQSLGERLHFEHLLSGLSARFVNISPDRVDSEIEFGLRLILEFFRVDRCGLLQILPSKTSWQITHIASSDDVPPVPVGAELPKSIYPWVYEKLTEKHEVLSISRLDDLPPEANVDRQTCIEWGIRSFVNIPILIGESLSHIINVNSVKSERDWPAELFPRLRLLGEIFVNALERKRAEEESRQSERVLQQNEIDLRRLTGRMIHAHEEERSRLARELHDDLAQRLAVFAIDVGRLERHLTDPPALVREELREMKNGIIRISQDVHSLSRQLHPSILDDLGLIKAVESECAGFSRREGIEVVFNHENIPRVIPKHISLALYRIVQEGLRNISKHACAEHIAVSLKGIDHDVWLSVQDDGIGFDWAKVKEDPGLGFSSMRERVRLIQGEFSIKSRPEKGTVITVRAPL